MARRARKERERQDKLAAKAARADERKATSGERAANKTAYIVSWHKKHAARVAEIKSAWYDRNKDRKLPPEERDKMNARRRERARLFPAIRINASMSHRIRDGIAEEKEGRSWRTFVPYSLDDLMRHLERQFKKGMTWDNYGTNWQIDHILPLASFNIERFDSDEFRAAWALTNLQPLWSADNKRKNDRRLHLL